MDRITYQRVGIVGPDGESGDGRVLGSGIRGRQWNRILRHDIGGHAQRIHIPRH